MISKSGNSDRWESRRCLVTGCSGFIGTSLGNRLRELGAEVHGASRSRPASVAGLTWHACDVTSLDQVREVFRTVRPEFVFHLGGRVSGSRDLDLVIDTLSSVLIGTVNVLLASLSSNCQRIITTGSLQEPDQQLLGVPPSPYGAAKFASSAYARMFAAVYDLPVVIARPLMVYGPGQTDTSKLVPYVATRLLAGSTAELSSGAGEFDWVFIDDVVEALVRIAVQPDIEGRTIDVGTGILSSVRDVAGGIARRLELPGKVVFGVVPDRRLEPTRPADVRNAENLLGWRAAVALEEGLDRTVRWFLDAR